MAYPPITHSCSAYPTPMHSARISTRWGRHSQLSNEDWREGGMGTPLVHDFPFLQTTVNTGFGTAAFRPPPPKRSFRASVRNSWRSSMTGNRHRWSILSASTPAPAHGFDDVNQAPPPLLRKRKRWSNAIGSTTTTIVGTVRSSWSSFNTPNSTFSESESAGEEVTNVRQRGRKRKRFLYGMAMSFGGLGAAGRVVG